MVVLAVTVGIVLVTLKSTGDTVSSSESQSAAGAETRRVFGSLERDLREASISSVDTQFRSVQQGLPANTWARSHYLEAGSSRLKQCYNASSPWNTQATGADRPLRTLLSRFVQFTTADGQTFTKAYTKLGRAWISILPAVGACPIDQTYLTQGVYLDAVKFFSFRGKGTGQFVTAEFSAAQAAAGTQKLPDAQAIVVYAPYYDEASRDLQLRRYVVFKDDIFDPAQPHAQLWTGNSPAGVPTMIDLMDFGTDSTTNGTRDGSVPVSAATSDAHYEQFHVYSHAANLPSTSGFKYRDVNGAELDAPAGAYVYWNKVFGTPGSNPYRYFYLSIDRGTGEITGSFSYLETTGSWSRSFSIKRRPAIVAHHLLDVDFSTNVDNPHDAVANPTGVINPRVVRVAVGLDRQAEVSGGQKRRREVVLVSKVYPRNR